MKEEENTLPEYSTNDPKGWCGDPTRGAAMGRPTVREADPEQPVKLVLRQVRLDAGGYDRNGTYFGHGGRLYWYANSDGTVDAMLRADSRVRAKAEIRETYPNARFYN
jgi:hypothetical protein